MTIPTETDIIATRMETVELEREAAKLRLEVAKSDRRNAAEVGGAGLRITRFGAFEWEDEEVTAQT
jgi:hypothetical protein